jgi:uncharacterized protein YbjT (DUF2867 family)
MKIVVVGGSGLIGSRLVTMLTCDGHEVVAASRRSGVDVITGEGLAEALSGASVVVDASNFPFFEDGAVMKFFKTSTHNLLIGEAAAGVGHHVALSVVAPGVCRAATFGRNLRRRSWLETRRFLTRSFRPRRSSSC